MKLLAGSLWVPVPFGIKKFSILQRILFKGTRMMIWNVLQGNMIKMIYEGHLGTGNSERGQRYFLVFLK